MKKYIITFALVLAVSSQAYPQSEPPYGMSEIQAYSIFYENYRTGDYNMALMFGKWMLEKKPRTIQGVNRFSLPRQYERMINVYAEISKRENDPSLRSAYIDTAIAIYEDAFATFEEGDDFELYTWHFNRGRFFQEHQSIIRDGMERAYEDYERAFELDPERLIQAGDGYYIQIMLSNYVSNNDRDRALEFIDAVEPMANAALIGILDEARDGLFADPEERIGFLESRLDANPEDISIIVELASLYENLGMRAKAIEFAERVYEMEKTFPNVRRLADYAKADGQTQRAIRFLQEGLELTDNVDVRKNVTLEIAELYQNEGNLRTARQFARQAINLDRNWGQPYIRMSRIYAAAISQCTSGRQIDRDDRTVYWLVLDYLDRAASVDPSTAATAARERRTYEPVMPSAEDKFFRGWETGDEFTIGANVNECYAWIDETTRVR
jgi:tetratricopeptide (TPR) repeat protein